MTERTEQPALSEARVEALLEEFFRREMPAELQRVADRRSEAAGGSSPRLARWSASWRRPGPAGIAGIVGASAAVALALVALTIHSPPTPDARPAAPQSSSGSESGAGSGVLADESDAAAPADLLQLSVEEGPVELRSRRQIEKVRATDSGTGVEAEYPELDILVFPIEDE